jgi:hypothetical protein
MVPFLGYRIQEKAYGELKPATRSQVLRIARALENTTSTTEWLNKPKIKPGLAFFASGVEKHTRSW